MDKLIDVLKALSDETRLRILNILYEQELCVCDIMEALQISQAKASRHLIYMKNAGLVKDRKHAQWVYYSMHDNGKRKFIEELIRDGLRNTNLYLDDMENLKVWLGKKSVRCD